MSYYADNMLERESFRKNILKKDKDLILRDSKIKSVLKNFDALSSSSPIIADFTEYNPLHNGHLHCMREAQRLVPEGIFTAVIPGPLESSGRGLPYIMTRKARSDAAVALGADIVVEGPPMGVMGSGQYSLCLAKMFQSLGTDFIPRGYNPMEGFQKIMKRINQGVGVAPRPYKMVDMETHQILMQGKLEEDNYVIVSLSRSLTKINFAFKDKFIFIKRIKGVSGTKIREAVLNANLKSVETMIPPETINILKNEMEGGRAPLHDVRDTPGILKTVNNSSLDYLKSISLVDEVTANALVQERPFKTLKDVEICISQGFSRHYRQRVISSLEAGIGKDTIHKYIENYPSVIRILKYKNKEILKEFKKAIPHRRLEICH